MYLSSLGGDVRFSNTNKVQLMKEEVSGQHALSRVAEQGPQELKPTHRLGRDGLDPPGAERMNQFSAPPKNEPDWPENRPGLKDVLKHKSTD